MADEKRQLNMNIRRDPKKPDQIEMQQPDQIEMQQDEAGTASQTVSRPAAPRQPLFRR